MYKKHLIENIEREITLLKAMIPLIKPEDLGFRPVEKVRSTYELMQYLSSIGGVIFRWMIKNDITAEVRAEIAEHRKTLTIENFSDRLDNELRVMKMYLSELSDADLLSVEVELPWKEKMVLGSAIINCPIKWLATYRMELFLYLKMNGNASIGTKEAWVPLDLRQPA
ncbi:MAG: hypothetical protein K0Q95_21 [Bacteroidota bacterium]|jgi:hypothetical protein|nr:hypothetical protein [Bacteroidota bacterium]